MPTHDCVGLHNDQGRSPILPRLGEEDPKQSIARTEVRMPDRASENPQLLTQCHVFKRDGSVTTTEQPERTKQNDQRGQHALSCRPIELESTGGVGDQVLASHTIVSRRLQFVRLAFSY
jgi:hypothetical protein